MRRRRGRTRVAVTGLLVVALAAAVAVVAASRSGSPSRRATPAKRRGDRPPPRPRIVHGRHDHPVPILMYHVIARPDPGAPYPELFTPPHAFEAQMEALARRGYHGVTLRQLDLFWHRSYALPSRPIVVSFDDGYLSDYTRARPVLHRLGWPGVLNLEVNNARTPGDISVPEVQALIGDGWEVESHTVTHPDLTTLPDDSLRRELVRSREWLRRRFHVPVDYFCYPAGRYDARVVAAVRAAGYRMATTTKPGLASPERPFELARIRVDGSDGVDGLLAKLAHPDSVPQTYAGG